MYIKLYSKTEAFNVLDSGISWETVVEELIQYFVNAACYRSANILIYIIAMPPYLIVTLNREDYSALHRINEGAM